MIECKHLEVNDFGIYTVDSGEKMQRVMLLKCSSCHKYLTIDGNEVSGQNIVSRESISKSKMRTITTMLNGGVFQELEDLLVEQIGDDSDPSKIMNEIVALGLKQYKSTLA